MVTFYPTSADDVSSYSHNIKNYRRLTVDDKKILVNDFKEFYKYVFWHQNLPSPTRDQLFMAKFVSQASYSTEPLMLECQRGLAKSLTLQIFTTWLLLRDPNEKIVVVSATSGRAESFTKFCLQLIVTIPLLMHLEPSGGDRTSQKKFDVSGRTPDDSPSMAAFGVTGAKAGSRATFIIYDDVEILENSDTVGKREKLLKGVRDTIHLGVSNVYRATCICTPQSSESVYDVMVKENGYKRTIIPAEYPEKIENYDGALAPHIERVCRQEPHRIGTATDKRNNEQHLNKQKVGMTRAEYKLHYMLDTTLTDAERYPLKLADLIVMPLQPDDAPLQIIHSNHPKDALSKIKHKGFRGDGLYRPSYASEDKRAKYEGIAMFIDVSGKGKDKTAYAVSAQLNGKIFILDAAGLDGGYSDEVLVQLSEIAKRFKVNLIRSESNMGDGMFNELLKPVLKRVGYQCKVDGQRATTNKFKRIIETLEPVTMQHRLVIEQKILQDDMSVVPDHSFTYQFTHVSGDGAQLKHDDFVDAIEMAVEYWTAAMARDGAKAIENYKAKQLQDSIDELKAKMLKNRAKPKKSGHRFAGF